MQIENLTRDLYEFLEWENHLTGTENGQKQYDRSDQYS